MNVVSPECVLCQMQWRYAVKKFDPTRKIAPEHWKALEQSLVLSPSSFGLQPWKFFIVADPAVRAALLPFSWGQRQVVDASHLVVFAIKTNLGVAEIDRYLARMAEVRGIPQASLDGLKKMMVGGLVSPAVDINIWATHQVYLALGFFMTAAAMLGIDTCPMEGFEPERYDEILGLPALGYHAVVLCPAGYRHEDDRHAKLPKVRFSTEDVVVHLSE